MAALRGYVESDRRNGSTATRLGSVLMGCGINTWEVKYDLTVRKDGSGDLRISEYGTGKVIKTVQFGPNGSDL